mmetsp:Transcript_26301/g.66767  ORF Transcript_26301/g.66767 Transcript_26301/m.66767 type:complete len:301 (-) Transcript_26301:85-987(-)
MRRASYSRAAPRPPSTSQATPTTGARTTIRSAGRRSRCRTLFSSTKSATVASSVFQAPTPSWRRCLSCAMRAQRSRRRPAWTSSGCWATGTWKISAARHIWTCRRTTRSPRHCRAAENSQSVRRSSLSWATRTATHRTRTGTSTLASWLPGRAWRGAATSAFPSSTRPKKWRESGTSPSSTTPPTCPPSSSSATRRCSRAWARRAGAAARTSQSCGSTNRSRAREVEPPRSSDHCSSAPVYRPIYICVGARPALPRRSRCDHCVYLQSSWLSISVRDLRDSVTVSPCRSEHVELRSVQVK